MLKRPHNLDDDDMRPFAHIKEYQASLVPHEYPHADHIPDYLINFLQFDIWNYLNSQKRIKHLAFCVSDKFIMSTHRLWERIMFNILTTRCGCCRLYLRSGADHQCLILPCIMRNSKKVLFTQSSHESLRRNRKFLHLLITINEKK